jgi:hypothetical protein
VLQAADQSLREDGRFVALDQLAYVR